MQGIFLLCSFFFGPDLILFYTAVIITGLELLEETILVGMLKKWEANVKGIYWVMRRKGT
jgi:CDP-diacylglycerol--glycerol-3-phosphate 3-phosphatidyltransferase